MLIQWDIVQIDWAKECDCVVLDTKLNKYFLEFAYLST